MKEIRQELRLAKEELTEAQRAYLVNLKGIQSRCPHEEYEWLREFNEWDCSTTYYGICKVCEHEITVEWGDELFYEVHEKYWEGE